jgi:DNA/RNA-binding domain of Phe-tRNA-synthetase-like protein
VTFRVAPECRRLGLRAGAIVFDAVRVTSAPPELRAAAETAVARLRRRFADRRAVQATAELAAFREIYRSAGVGRARARPGLERLLGLALERGDLPAVNNVVDVYNLLSLGHLVSVGAHDLETLALPVRLTLARGGERYVPLGRRESETLGRGEFAYLDAEDRVICRLDVRQADFSKVTERTRRVLMIIEGTAAHDPRALETAFDEAARLMAAHCGGSTETVVPPGDAD